MGYKDVIKSLDLKEIVCMWLGIMAFIAGCYAMYSILWILD
ncbi:hypothetical protein BJV85_002050 [Clostridium acetobutylicum]|nr:MULTISPECIES: hypothetical protein [Clostridium]NOV88976.1 hypothetical protein [Clostridium acetobutylicum]NOV89068.1 hypothetical protein [Clostridium acetobutylicum]NOW12597.1 hypothetical protein [Clostridium acetobutylicum]NOW12686.1 hypothetical protein [Clostridium acetobutylicum]NRY55062.1 hypothetical protein [Clostridium acetobutylicum]